MEEVGKSKPWWVVKEKNIEGCCESQTICPDKAGLVGLPNSRNASLVSQRLPSLLTLPLSEICCKL